MKRIVLALATTVLLPCIEGSAQDGPAKCSGKNGDVNADGIVDLSDAVTILLYLFLGNPTELVPPCDPPEVIARLRQLEEQLARSQAELATCQDDLRLCTESSATLTIEVTNLQTQLAECRADNCPPGSPLPATGQTQCYDQSGAAVPCAGAVWPGQDAFHHTGCSADGRFIDNGDGTVTDNCTELMWQKDTADVNGDGIRDDSDRVAWGDALVYCEGLNFARHADWRLPNVRELHSIADYGRHNPAIDPVFGALSLSYWSSTTVASLPQLPWHVSFADGDVGFGFRRDDLLHVRAVRSGRSPLCSAFEDDFSNPETLGDNWQLVSPIPPECTSISVGIEQGALVITSPLMPGLPCNMVELELPPSIIEIDTSLKSYIEFDLDNGEEKTGLNQGTLIGLGYAPGPSYAFVAISERGEIPDRQRVKIGYFDIGERHELVQTPAGVLLSPGRYRFSIDGGKVRFENVVGSGTTILLEASGIPVSKGGVLIRLNEEISRFDNIEIHSSICPWEEEMADPG